MVDQADCSTRPEEQINRTEADPSPIAHPLNESVASLLSQLEFPAMDRNAGPSNSARVFAGRVNQNQTRPAELDENRKNISFRAALPILSELAENESFLSGVKKVRLSSSVESSNFIFR